jgi:CrcB protein
MTLAIVPWAVLAGGVGALVRYLILTAMPVSESRPFPRGVLLVNALGSLIAGVTLGFVDTDTISMDVALITWAGLCGGLTTFSTVAVETILIGRERASLAGANIVSNVVLGCASAGIGFTLVLLLLG